MLSRLSRRLGAVADGGDGPNRSRSWTVLRPIGAAERHGIVVSFLVGRGAGVEFVVGTRPGVLLVTSPNPDDPSPDDSGRRLRQSPPNQTADVCAAPRTAFHESGNLA